MIYATFYSIRKDIGVRRASERIFGVLPPPPRPSSAYGHHQNAVAGHYQKTAFEIGEPAEESRLPYSARSARPTNGPQLATTSAFCFALRKEFSVLSQSVSALWLYTIRLRLVVGTHFRISHVGRRSLNTED